MIEECNCSQALDLKEQKKHLQIRIEQVKNQKLDLIEQLNFVKKYLLEEKDKLSQHNEQRRDIDLVLETIK